MTPPEAVFQRSRKSPGGLPSLAALLVALSFAPTAIGASSSKPPHNPEALKPDEARRAGRPLSGDARRPTPDYDGRPEQPEDPDNAGIWALRVVFFPAYLVSEYVVRRPLGWVTVQAERANIVDALVDFFTFGPDRQGAFFPTALIDFGFTPSVGLYFMWDDAFAPNNELRIHAATWGPEWLRLTLADRYYFMPESHVGLRLQGWRRPDWLFFGIGPRADHENGARYTRRDLNGSLRLELGLPRTSWFGAYAGVYSSSFEDTGCCDEPDLRDFVRWGVYAMPPGASSGYTLYRQGLELALDSREERPAPGSGLRAVVRAEQNVRIAGDAADQWVRYGGSLGAFVDLGNQRVIGLSVGASFADPVGDGEIPFTEQVTLGGSAPLRGFLEGRLIDRSAAVARLEYTWPVWVLLDGSLNVEAGNVFGAHLDGFSPELARLSFGFGVRPHGRRDQPFEALIGFGTKPLDEGAHIEAVRIVFGVNNGL